MNKHWVLALAAFVGFTACSRSTQLAVRTVSDGQGEAEVGLAQLQIRLLPYDRDSIFEALARQFAEPEPQPPVDLLSLRDSISVAQERWRAAEAIWNEQRSQLETLSERMKGMSRTSREYANAFRQFDQLDGQLRRLDRDKQRFFERFTELQSAYRTKADSFNAVVLGWGDEAFEGFSAIVDSLLEARGVQELYDTTDASGWAYFDVPSGQWWIYTRYELPFQEMYWNVAYRSEGGADTLALSTTNAELRPIF